MMELTNSLIKLIRSLNETKHRKASGLFKAEGVKCVSDTIGYFPLEYLVCSQNALELFSDNCDPEKLIKASPKGMERISSFASSPDVIAVYRIPEYPLNEADFEKDLTIALDGIQDPGNLGTIIRTADWFGIHDIVCSQDTVDVFNPKVVQATMGAISRVTVHYCELEPLLGRLRKHTPVFGTFLDGDNLYEAELPASGIIVMGNEGKGVSKGIGCQTTHRLKIPAYPPDSVTSESLNVATATAVIVAELRRRSLRNK